MNTEHDRKRDVTLAALDAVRAAGNRLAANGLEVENLVEYLDVATRLREAALDQIRQSMLDAIAETLKLERQRVAPGTEAMHEATLNIARRNLAWITKTVNELENTENKD
jgi:hypothetical protein